MKKQYIILLVLVVIALIAGAFFIGRSASATAWLQLQIHSLSQLAGVGAAHSNSSGYAKGEILIKFNPGVDAANERALMASWKLAEKEEIGALRIKILSVPEGKEEQLVEALSHNPNVEFAELNQQVMPLAVPNDPLYLSQWHLPVISGPGAWDVANGSGVTIAILDSGVAATHPDLAANIVAGYNVVSANGDSSDIKGHGTAVAGSAAAVGNNATQIAGVAHGAKIMPIRITNSTDGYAYSSDMAKALIYAIDHGAKIANLSYTGVCTTDSNVSIKNAAAYGVSKGCLVISAAANDA